MTPNNRVYLACVLSMTDIEVETHLGSLSADAKFYLAKLLVRYRTPHPVMMTEVLISFDRAPASPVPHLQSLRILLIASISPAVAHLFNIH